MVYSMKRRFCTLIITLLLALSISAWQVNAAGGGGGDDDVDKPVSDEQINFDAGVRAVYAGKYDKAIELMTKVLKDNSKNADAYNYLGFFFAKKAISSWRRPPIRRHSTSIQITKAHWNIKVRCI